MSKKLNNLSESVMLQIDRDHIAMKPRWYFIFGSISLAMGIIGSAILSTFLVSFVSFSLKTHGPMGEIRYQQLASNFPWWAPIIAIVGLIVGIMLLKKYDFSYRKNFPLMIIVFIVVVLFSGWLIDYFEMNTIWSRQGPLRGLYQQYDGGWRGGNGKGKRQSNAASNSGSYVLPQNQDENMHTIKIALDEAISDEYKAFSTYEKVIQTFGQVRSFSMIINAEEQHIASLLTFYERYAIEPPINSWTDNITTPESIEKACQIGVEAEIANVALYREKLLPLVSEFPDIESVFTNLMLASEQKHLPAFERCQ